MIRKANYDQFGHSIREWWWGWRVQGFGGFDSSSFSDIFEDFSATLEVVPQEEQVTEVTI